MTGFRCDRATGRASEAPRSARTVTLHALFFISRLYAGLRRPRGVGQPHRAVAHRQSELLGKIAGVLVAGFGLHTMGILTFPGSTGKRDGPTRVRTGRPHHSFLIGMAFAAGWTPCVGPILGGILAIASVHATLWDGVKLLFSYAVGMGLPFLLMAATLGKSTALLDILKRRHRPSR